MNVIEIINKKRKGQKLTDEEIKYVVDGFTNGDIPDYQMSALLMAITINGMSIDETTCLTLCMRDSGERYSYPDAYLLDKHSTGGVGDNTTFIMVPILASLGYDMIKMSGRGLGHTGGTKDKFEVIEGFRHDLTTKQIEKVLKKEHAVFIGAKDIAPADKKIYALRDVTATTESVPLICSSILSKKLACGANGMVFDVKCGNGALVKNMSEAMELVLPMKDILTREKVKSAFIISNMDSPLGKNVGCAYEIAEAIKVLNGEKGDLRELSLALCAHAMMLRDNHLSYIQAYSLAADSLDSGRAKQKFVNILLAQGAKFENIDDYMTPPKTQYSYTLKSDKDGVITSVNSLSIGKLVRDIGGGRMNEEDILTPNVGVETFVSIGDAVKSGDKLAVVHYEDKSKIGMIKECIKNAFTLGKKHVKKKLILKVIK